MATVTIAAGATGTGYLFGDVPQVRKGKLPTTGSNTMLPLGIGLGGCVLGLSLVMAGRRRRSAAR